MTYFYHAVLDSPHLPRDLGTDSAQSAIATLFGELWPCDQPASLPSAGLVSLLASIGLSEAATRAALSRMSRRGTLDLLRNGRRTLYRLSDEVANSIPQSEVLTMGFGSGSRDWTGQWTVVIFSIPETQRNRRQSLREWLRWLGFGPIRDGVWVSPHADVDVTYAALTGLLPEDGLIFRSSHVLGTIDPSSVWPLEDIAHVYREFVSAFRPHVYELRTGTLPPAAALRSWITVLGRWRGFPTVDPDLPEEALPPDWPRREARRIFEAVHDAAVPYVAELVRRHFMSDAPDAAGSIRALSVSESLSEYAMLAAARRGPKLSDVAPSFLPSARQIRVA